jgi:hypothetical protein
LVIRSSATVRAPGTSMLTHGGAAVHVAADNVGAAAVSRITNWRNGPGRGQTGSVALA